MSISIEPRKRIEVNIYIPVRISRISVVRFLISLISYLSCVKIMRRGCTGINLEMNTYNESVVSARVIVVLCIEISCNSFIALLAFKGHASAARVAL